MNKALADLIRISNITGRDPNLVQGGGGNTSIKTPAGRYMYIKASGTALKDMNSRTGWRRLRLDSALAIIKDKSIAKLNIRQRETEVANRLLLACDDKFSRSTRPSIEAHLHAIFDRCVIHLHPAAVLSYACAVNGRAELKKLFKDEKLPPLWVHYANPGFALAIKVAKLTDDYQNRFNRKPAVLFLQKHGLIVSANSPDAALHLLQKVIKRCAGKLKFAKTVKAKPPTGKAIADIKLCLRRGLYSATGRYPAISYFYDDEIAAFLHQNNARKLLSTPALTPAELLYANGPPIWIEDCAPKKIADRLTSKIEKGERLPVAFLVKGAGLFVTAKQKAAATIRDIVKSSLIIRTNASHLGGILALSKTERYLINQFR